MTLSEKETDAILQKVYYDPKIGLVSVDRLYKKLKSHGVTREEVDEFLKKQQVQQLHYQPKKPMYYPIYSMMDGSYQADLMFYPRLKKINNGYDTILTCIEITTRKGYCIPMKGKKTQAILDAFGILINKTSKCGMPVKILTTDLGSEWISDAFNEVATKQKIHHFTAQEGDHHKMGMIERFNRTMKALLGKYFTAFNTKGKWIDTLEDIVYNYNHTFHRGIQCTPMEAEKSKTIRAQIRGAASFKTSLLDHTRNLHVGDRVRVLRNRNLFEKEGPKWSRQIYEIEKDDITTFKLKGQDRVYKHYELRKVQEVETNPLVRIPQSFDVEQHLAQARENRPGPSSSVQHRPQTRHQGTLVTRNNEGQRSRGPSEAQVKEINDLKGELIGVEFIDEGIKWKIVDVKWNGKYLKIMVYYYDTDKYKRVPPVSDQEYSTVNLIREMLPGNNL